jgi:Protein of unknown function (DUF2442)
MSTSRADARPLAAHVELTNKDLIVDLVDGRRIEVPLSWFPRLERASAKDRRNMEILGDGEGIHWPALDEDLGVAGLLLGNRAPKRRTN